MGKRLFFSLFRNVLEAEVGSEATRFSDDNKLFRLADAQSDWE